MSGLFDCVAGDTRVLTHSGWKTIVTVTLSDRVWDGFNWVRHDGVIHKGVRHTISLGGVGITPNHEVLVGEDWVNASDVELDAAQRSEERRVGKECRL